MYQIYWLQVANWRCRLHAQQIFLLHAYKFCNMKICHLFRGALQENIAHITSNLAQMPLSKQRRENTKIILNNYPVCQILLFYFKGKTNFYRYILYFVYFNTVRINSIAIIYIVSFCCSYIRYKVSN